VLERAERLINRTDFVVEPGAERDAANRLPKPAGVTDMKGEQRPEIAIARRERRRIGNDAGDPAARAERCGRSKCDPNRGLRRFAH